MHLISRVFSIGNLDLLTPSGVLALQHCQHPINVIDMMFANLIIRNLLTAQIFDNLGFKCI